MQEGHHTFSLIPIKTPKVSPDLHSVGERYQSTLYSQNTRNTNCCQKISFSHRFSAHPPQATNNISWDFGAESCQNISFLSALSSAHIIPKANQQPPKYYILTCIECAYYSKGKEIFFEIFQHRQLPKYSIFMCISCAFYTKGKAIFSETFRHQWLPIYSIFMCIDCTSYSEGKQYSPKYLGTNCCRKISFSHGSSAHVPQATNNIPWSISPPRAKVIFTCIE